MSSLQTVALGLVIVFLDAGSGGWDWIADPVGWVLVLMGLTPLKELLPGYPGTLIGGWVCLVVSVLVFPPGSVVTIDPALGWLFSLPALAFCFLLCDGLADVTPGSFPLRFKVLRAAYVVVAALPALVYLVGWEWMSIPTKVVVVLTNAGLVVTLWSAGDEDEDGESGFSAERIRSRRTAGGGAASPAPAQTALQTSTRPEHKAETPLRKTVERSEDTASDGSEGGGWSLRGRKREQGFSAEEVRRRLRKEREEREAAEARAAREAQAAQDARQAPERQDAGDD